MRMRPDFELAKNVDLRLRLDDHIKALTPAMFCWSRTIREAIGLPVVSLAQRLEISQQAATKLEQNESAGTISIARLESLANALDCELVYGFIPRRPLVERANQIQDQQDAAKKAKRKIPRPV